MTSVEPEVRATELLDVFHLKPYILRVNTCRWIVAFFHLQNFPSVAWPGVVHSSPFSFAFLNK